MAAESRRCLAVLLCWQGRGAEAVAVGRRALDDLGVGGDGRRRSACHVALAAALLAVGDLSGAAEHARAAVDSAASAAARARALAQLVRQELAAGRPGPGVRHAHEARLLLRPLGALAVPDRARTLELAARWER